MSKRTVAEFKDIAQSIIDEYQAAMVEASVKLKKEFEKKLPDMNKNEAVIFFTMFSNVENEIEKVFNEETV